MADISTTQASKMLKALDENHAMVRQMLVQLIGKTPRKKRRVIRRPSKKAAKQVQAKKVIKVKKITKKTAKRAKRPMPLEIYSGKAVPFEALRVLAITLHDLRDFKTYNVEPRTTQKYLIEYAHRLNAWLVGGTPVKRRYTDQVKRFIGRARRRKAGTITCKMELSLNKSYVVYTVGPTGISIGLETDNKGFEKKWRSWNKQMLKKYGPKFKAAYPQMRTDIVVAPRKAKR